MISGGAFEVEPATLDEPVNLELNTSVNHVVKVATCVLEGEGVGVDEIFGDEHVEFRREVGKRCAGLVLLVGGGWSTC